MSSVINYIIESSISLTVFYIFYEFFLKRDTWFRFNRYYLLFGLIFSFILPLLNFSASSIAVNSQNQFEFNEIVNLGNSISAFEKNTIQKVPKINYLGVLYFIIGGLFFVRTVYQIIKIIKTIIAYEKINYKGFKIILINKDSAPFSFFNFIFINKDDYGSIGSSELLLHEITHARQAHSFDIILLELLLVLHWFNPFIYRYRLAIKEVHEYLADRGVILKNRDKLAYQKLILGQIEKSFKVNLASQFNYSLTKNRIKMMTRINSSKTARFKTLLVLPLVIFLLSAFTIDTAKDNFIDRSNFSIVTVDINSSDNIPSIFPVKKVEGVKISSGYGMRVDPLDNKKKMHVGTDIKAPTGTPVYATADGLIRKVKKNYVDGKGYGKHIIIDHEHGYSTLYAMLNKCNVTGGQEVKKGDIIGLVGSTGRSTGPHLHYEVMKDGENVNPEDYF